VHRRTPQGKLAFHFGALLLILVTFPLQWGCHVLERCQNGAVPATHERLERSAFAFHRRPGSQPADIAQTEHCGVIGDDRYQVAACRVFERAGWSIVGWGDADFYWTASTVPSPKK